MMEIGWLQFVVQLIQVSDNFFTNLDLRSEREEMQTNSQLVNNDNDDDHDDDDDDN